MTQTRIPQTRGISAQDCGSRPAFSRPGCAAQRGFTLLEMLLVVFILGMLAFSASALVDNQDDQLRYEDTRSRLLTIRAAIIGKPGDGVPAGYVADNGVLPGQIDDLTSGMPTDYTTSALQTPLLDSDPDAASGLDDASNVASLSGQRLEKGWRATLHTPPGAAGFGDGWRAVAVIAKTDPNYDPNFNWTLVSSLTDLSITSLGKDAIVTNPPNAPLNYKDDMTDTVAPAAWGKAVDGLTVRVSNQRGTDIAVRLRASLLVFQNGAAGVGRWKRYSSDATPCLDGDGDGNALVGSVVTMCNNPVTLTFPPGGYPPSGAYASTRVPLGRHLLVLVQDSNDDAHDGTSTTESYYPILSSPDPTKAVALPIVCTAAGCPIETLVIR